jgi:hypothetical protein
MGGTCSTHGAMRCAYQIYESLKGRDHLEDLRVDGRIIVNWTLKK